MTANDIPLKSTTLLGLPAELRHRIFYLCLLSASPSCPATIKTAAETYLSLQLTCHSISTETRLLAFHALPLALPCNFGTNASSVLQALRRMKEWQVRAIRKVEFGVLGTVHDAVQAGKVIEMLREGTEGVDECWARRDVSPEVASMFADDWGRRQEQHPALSRSPPARDGALGSELREITLKITARDVITPMADSAVGMEKMLDLETCPFFVELANGATDGRFRMLRKVVIEVELGPSLKGVYTKEITGAWEAQLLGKLNTFGERKGECEVASDGDEDVASSRQGGSRSEVAVEATFKPSSSTAAVEYSTALADSGLLTGDDLWWNDSMSAAMGNMGAAMTMLGAPLGRSI